VTPPLFTESIGRVRCSNHWFLCRDGDAAARAVFHRHYSFRRYADGREPKLFVGPGEKMVLLTEIGDALFVWRKFISGDGQQGVNCSVFRNESDILSSALILDAENAAWTRWSRQRLYTYVNPNRIESRNPGFCFKKADWRECGRTKWKGLVILEKTSANRPKPPKTSS
jgi:hypothetical protein